MNDSEPVASTRADDGALSITPDDLIPPPDNRSGSDSTWLELIEKSRQQQKAGVNLRQMSEGRGADAMRVNPFSIEIEPGFNCRDWRDPTNIAHVQNLATLIAMHGFDASKAIEVWFDPASRKVYLIDGECRLRAARHAIRYLDAKFTTVPVVSSQVKLDPYQRSLKPLNANNGRRPPLLERAGHVRSLALKHGKTLAEISRDINVALPTIESWLEVYDAVTLCEELHLAVVLNQISATAAKDLAKKAGFIPDAIRAALARASGHAVERENKRKPAASATVEPAPAVVPTGADAGNEPTGPGDKGKPATADGKKAQKPNRVESAKSIFSDKTEDEDASTIPAAAPEPRARIRHRDVLRATNSVPVNLGAELKRLFVTDGNERNYEVSANPKTSGLNLVSITLSDDQLETLERALGLADAKAEEPSAEDDVNQDAGYEHA